MPQLYAAEDKLQPLLEEETAVCKEECPQKGSTPVMKLFLSFLLMDKNGWDTPLDAYAVFNVHIHIYCQGRVKRENYGREKVDPNAVDT